MEESPEHLPIWVADLFSRLASAESGMPDAKMSEYVRV